MVLNRSLRALLKRLGLDENAPPDWDRWVVLLAHLNDHFRQTEDERHRLQRSLDIHGREIQGLYRELVNEREKLSSAIGCLTAGFIVFDRQGAVTLMNAEAEQMLGWSEAEWSNRNLLQHLRLEDAFQVGDVMAYLQAGRSLQSEACLVGKDGLPVDVRRAQLQPVLRDGQLYGAVLTLEQAPAWKGLEGELDTLVEQVARLLEREETVVIESFLRAALGKARQALGAVRGEVGEATLDEGEMPAVALPAALMEEPPVEAPLVRRSRRGSARRISTSRKRAAADPDPAPPPRRIELPPVTAALPPVAVPRAEELPAPPAPQMAVARPEDLPPPPAPPVAVPRAEELPAPPAPQMAVARPEDLPRPPVAVALPESLPEPRPTTVIVSVAGPVPVPPPPARTVSAASTIAPPAAGNRSPGRPPARPTPPPPPLRVLLVEDEPVSQLVTQSHLDKLGHDVVVAGDGNEALRLHQRQPFDAIISSYLMPGISGIELCRKIREDSRGGYPYFILLTAVEKREEATRALEAGVDAFLTKPLDPNELSVRLKVARGVQSRLQKVYSEFTSGEG